MTKTTTGNLTGSLEGLLSSPRVAAGVKLKQFLLDCRNDALAQNESQASLAARMEKTRAQINKVFIGTHVPSLVTLEAIAQALGGELRLVYVPKKSGNARSRSRVRMVTEPITTDRRRSSRKSADSTTAERMTLPAAAKGIAKLTK